MDSIEKALYRMVRDFAPDINHKTATYMSSRYAATPPMQEVARLARIGAAVGPMLAALRHYRDDHDDRRDATCRCGWCDIARAAIAAATGEDEA